MTREVLEFGRLQRGVADSSLSFLAFFALVAVLLWVYRRDASRLAPATRAALMILRLIVCSLLFFIFLDPQLRTETTIERPSRVALVVDRSLSMTIVDEASSSPSNPADRSSQVIAALRDGPLVPLLRKTHDVALYGFGKSTESIGLMPRAASQTPQSSDPQRNSGIDWDALKPRDDETRIGDALADAYRDSLATPLAGVVLLTDGQNNSGTEPQAAVRMAKDAQAPIFAVGVGAERLPVNLRISDVQVPARAFKGDQFRGKAFVRGVGMAGSRATVEVLLKPRDQDVQPTLIETLEVPLPDDDSLVPIEFKYLPEVPGQWQIVVRAAQTPGEALGDDNAASAGFDVVDQKTKVLLLAGGPTREYRFLRNLLFRDPSIDVAVHLQSSGGAAQEADELVPVLPESRDDLFRFDVIVAIDPDWAAVPATTLTLLQEWVSSQAGGLILVAGAVNASRVARMENRAPLDALYPVVLKEVFTSDFDAGRYLQPWPIDFTPEGELASYLQLDDDPELSRERWEQFQGVYWCFPVVSVKPAATVLAHFGDPRAQTGGVTPPVFASQFYGSGRVFYLGTGEMWRLRQMGEQYYDRFWIRVVREMNQGRLLRGATRGVILVQADRFSVGSNIQVRAQVLGNDYQPLLEKSVPLSIVDARGVAFSVDLAAQVGRPGMFSSLVPLRAAGEYRLQLLVPGTDEIVERRITAEIPQRELADPRLNRALLEKIAAESGGQLLALNQIEQIPSLLKDRTETSVMSGSPRPIWDNAWILLAVVLFASAEWLIRKLAYLA